MTLNKTLYKANDWMVVPKGTKYSITSGPKGYKAKCWCIIWNEK